MQPNKHIIVFSHGFGVRKDARGLFTDIAAAFPDAQAVMFDYNEADETNKTVTVNPLSKQAEKLKEVLREAGMANPGATIDLICHSQGGVVAAMAGTENIRKTIMLAPPAGMNFDRMIAMFRLRPGTTINLEGVSSFSRRDGSTTLVPAEYFEERKNIKPAELYKELSNNTELIIVKALQDEVLGDTDFPNFGKAKIIGVDGNHDFTGEAREKLLEVIKGLL